MSQVKRLLDLRRGRAEVARRLREFGQKAPEEITHTMMGCAAEISGLQSRLCGDDKELSASCGYGTEVPKGPSGVVRVKGKFGPNVVFVWAGSWKAYWARWREFGTAPHSVAKGADRSRGKLQDKGPMHPGTPASPFFWPVWRAFRQKTKKAMRVAYKSVAQKTFGNAK